MKYNFLYLSLAIFLLFSSAHVVQASSWSISISDPIMVLNDTDGNGYASAGESVVVYATTTNTDALGADKLNSGGSARFTSLQINLESFGCGMANVDPVVVDAGIGQESWAYTCVLRPGLNEQSVGNAGWWINYRDTDDFISSTDLKFLDAPLDTNAPIFAASNPVFVTLNGGRPTQRAGESWKTNNTWYGYPGNSLNLSVDAADSPRGDGGSSEPINARLCTKPFVTENPNDLCSLADFNNPSYYVAFPAGSLNLSYSFPTNSVTSTTTPTVYVFNVALVDVAGNITVGSEAPQTINIVFGLNPKNLSANLNNTNTTDWSTIEDYTATNYISNPLSFEWQSGSDWTRLTYLEPLDLTDTSTISSLARLSDYMIMESNSVTIKSVDAPILNRRAQLTFKLNDATQPGLIMLDEAGVVLARISNGQTNALNIAGHDLSDFSFDPSAREYTFTTSGFSSFVLDHTGPSTAITMAMNTFNTDTPITSGSISGTATDTQGDVGEVKISLERLNDNMFWDGASWGTSTPMYLSAHGTSSWSFDASLLPMSVGNYRVVAKAYDSVDNASTSTPAIFTWTSSQQGASVILSVFAQGGGGGSVSTVKVIDPVVATSSPAVATTSPIIEPIVANPVKAPKKLILGVKALANNTLFRDQQKRIFYIFEQKL